MIPFRFQLFDTAYSDYQIMPNRSMQKNHGIITDRIMDASYAKRPVFQILIKGENAMIRRQDDCDIEFREKMRDGNGTVEITNFIKSPEELCEKGRMFSRITLKSGCSIGFHVHEKDSELFYILSGEAEYNDNGNIVTVSAGDVTICPPGTGHGIENKTDSTVELIAVIVFA